MFGLTPIIWVALAVGNIPVYLFLIWVIFDDLSGFLDAVRYWFTPDAYSFLKGEWADDWSAEMKIFAFLLLGGGAVVGEGWLLARVILETV